MKKASISILLILICYLGYGQTYPLQQNVGNTPTTKVKTNALEGKIIITAFTDTIAANSEGYLKNYDGAVIKTTTPINALWYRVLDSAKWVQILPTGGGTGGIRAWLDGGNYNVLADGQGNAVFGTLGKNGIKFTTQAIPRFILDSAGILSETGSTIGIGYDPSNGNRLTQYSGGGGSGNYLDSFWRVSGIDSNYYRINGVTYAVLDSTGGGGTGWSLTGNSGTDPSTNFLGTTDAQDLVIKTNGIVIGRFSGDGLGRVQFGTNAIASGDYSFATGINTTASGYGTTAMGTGNAAILDNSVAMGQYSIASGYESFAMGQASEASGQASAAIGAYLKSKSYAGTVIGSYNDSTDAANSGFYDPLNRAFQIGNGTDDTTRSNALTVLFNGNTGIGTTTPDSTLHVVGGFKLVNGTQGNGKVLTSDANGGASWQTAGSSGVTSVTASSPLASSGGTTPDISLTGIVPVTNGGTGYSTYDTTALASFGGGSGAAGDTAVFSTSAIYGSFFNSGYDTLYITRIQVGLQGTSPSVAVKVWYNDSLNVTAGGTALVTAGNTCTDIYTGTSITTFDNYKIPPGMWVWVKTSTVTTKPTYFTLTLIGYKKRV